MSVTRSISAILMLALCFFLFIVGGYPLAGVLIFIQLVGFWELGKAFANPTPEPGAERAPLPAKKKIDYLDIIGLITIVIYDVVMIFTKSVVYQFVVVACFVIALLFVYVFSFPKVPIDRIAQIVFSFLYCPVMLSFVYMVRDMEIYGKYMIWIVLIGSWGCDTFALLFGVAFGKKKIFPQLSPKKSLAGCIGGLFSSAVMGGCYGYFYVMPHLRKLNGTEVDENPYLFLILAGIGLVAGLIGMLGDLVASGIKRNKGFKDYAKLIPGHGGIMDRFDSTIPVAPAVYLLTLLYITYISK